jgi:hypothetical protein
VQWAHSTNRFGLALSAVIVMHTIQIGGIEVIMSVERSMSSECGVTKRLVPVLFPDEKGVEIGLPTCVHFHVSRSTLRSPRARRTSRYGHGDAALTCDACLPALRCKSWALSIIVSSASKRPCRMRSVIHASI